MPKLIINADDFGLCSSVNEGIVECLLAGGVSDLSFMVRLGEFEQSVNLLKSIGKLNIGFHLNLTVGESPIGKKSPLTHLGQYPDLIRATMTLISGQISPRDIYDEILCQMEMILEAGFIITHVDSHRNIHLLPPVLVALEKVLTDLGLDVPIRFPYERNIFQKHLLLSNLFRMCILNFLSWKARRFYKNHSAIKTIGGNIFNHPTPRVVFSHLVDFINRSPSKAVFEIAVHPGYPSSKLRLYDAYVEPRLNELHFLKQEIPKWQFKNLRLINFSELHQINEA